jgi:hypothetical protein
MVRGDDSLDELRGKVSFFLFFFQLVSPVCEPGLKRQDDGNVTQ